jgi:L-alanine-DL-glutamate epimerase-like enolase superfamily enzyme
MNVAWERFTIHTKDPFRISRGVRTEEERVWLRIEADGLEGWGEADPSAYYGETADSVETAFEEARPLLERTTDVWSLERLDEDLRAPLAKDGSARAAISAALHDLIGKRLGQPLWRVWGLDRDAAPVSSFTIGIDEPEEVAAKVRRARDYPCLKIKVGTDRDEELLAAVRGEAPDATLRVDANAAWTAEEALQAIPMLVDHGVEFVEQPLPPEDRDGLRIVYERSSLPIILDESCIVASDVPGLVGLGHGINIKLAKCGGPREALRMIHVARACGLRVMMGCMLETTLGIAPAAHLAPLLDYADLDGAALLRDDPFEGPALEAGRIVLSEAPGLGVRRS